MSDKDHISDQEQIARLWDLDYDLLSEAEAEQMRERIQRDPRLANEYRKVQDQIELVAAAARMMGPPLDTRQLIELDHRWIPSEWGHSLYVRPLVIGTEATLEVRAADSYRFMIMTAPVGSYFSDLQNGVSLRVEDQYTRAATLGGLGAAKTAANYAASLLPGSQSQQAGFDQVLWLDGNEHRYVEEVGAMNIFFKIDGTVVTPPLGGSILPGVVRDTALTLLAD